MSAYFKIIIPLFLLACALSLGIGSGLPAWIFTILGLAYFGCSGFIVARRSFGFDRITSVILAPLLLIVVGIVGSVVYFLLDIRPAIIQALVFLPAIIACFAFIFKGQDRNTLHLASDNLKDAFRVNSPPFMLITAFYFFLTFLSFWLISSSATLQPVLGPWDLLHADFFALFFVRSVLVILITLLSRSRALTLSTFIIHSLSSVTLFQILFPLNYGFDPFIHQATERVIAATGLITPKQPYYVGFYVVVVFLSKILHLPLTLVDRWIVPITASLFVSAFSYFVLLKEKCRPLLGLTILLTLPFIPLLSPTPWGLAFVFFLLTALSGYLFLREPIRRNGIVLFLLALFSLLIHPIAGIPAIGFAFIIVGANWYMQGKNRLALIGVLIVFLGTSVALPVSFAINSLRSSALAVHFGLHGTWNTLLQVTSPLFPFIQSRFDAPLDFAHAIATLTPLLALALGVAGIYSLYKKQTPLAHAALLAYGLSALAMIISIVIFSVFIQFDGLISYEQSIYVDRIGSLLGGIMFPLVLLGFSWVIERILSQKLLLLKGSLIVFIAACMTASLYNSYPKRDAFTSYHGYTVSSHDIAAVRWIHEDAQKDGQDYIVLSNQVVASAAIGEYGFLKYFDVEANGKTEEVFYYPIPTSSPLYSFFTQMANKPSMATIDAVRSMMHVSHVYVVLTPYEASQASVERMRDVTPIDQYTDGASWVFKY